MYSVLKLRYGSLDLIIKRMLQVIKSFHKGDNIKICVYAINRNKHAELLLPSTLQTSDIELLSPQSKLIHLTKSPNRDHIFKMSL